ncbi:MAG: hypothetical protein IIA91_06440 [Chloroflexi bacterium]|nr:hypothetical protein [Chloroflexota bacterium]
MPRPFDKLSERSIGVRKADRAGSLLAAYLAFLGLIAVAAAAGGVLLFRDLSSGDPIDAVANRNAYDIVGWELRHLPEKWLYKLATVFDGDRSRAEEDVLIGRYFELTADIRSLERDGSDARRGDGSEAERLAEARREQRAIENDVEETLEGRISDLLRDEGIVMNPPFFSDIDLFFPPLDFELDRPPKVLAVSPRERIELDRSYLLVPGLEPEAVADVESVAEETGVSALVVNTGGVATYPSVIPELASYRSVVETIIHEWLHQYLVFYPLGRSYFSGQEARTLNETVANLAGRELADLFIQRYGSPTPLPSPSQTSADFDFRSEMRSLRLRVEELLTERRVEEAERLMNEKRDEFETRGVYIRRINQAYFAFYGSYADTPGSIDPIGPKLQRLRDRSGSITEFVLLARSLRSEADLDSLLAEA